jgi:isochorismate pyruvate lyase
MHNDILPDTLSEDLAEVRAEIDAIDAKLVTLLAQRQKFVSKVIDIKKRDGLPALIPGRVEEVIHNAATRAEAVGMSPDLARVVWRTMVNWFVAYEEEWLKSRPS